MIPEAKKTAVINALQATFGQIEFEEISELTAGLSSALVFRIVVRAKPYLLRIITRTDAMSDPTHWYDCMKTAAGAALAPRVLYTGVDDRISITDFIEKKTFPISDAKLKMPELLRRLHSLPTFPSRVNYLDALDGFIKKLQNAKILPEHLTSDLSSRYTHIKNAYPRISSDLVASHNDLKPENFIYDGDKVWLVDWEAAFLNDRYFDLAVIANFVIMSDEDEKDYLNIYFGEEVNEYHHSRFFIMRQVVHISYFTLFMLYGSVPGEQIDLNLAKLGFREFHNGIWSGEISLANNDARQQYAWVHMEQLLHNMQLKRFVDALQVVSNHQQS
jgi:thiamine kinase-like enzyme